VRYQVTQETCFYLKIDSGPAFGNVHSYKVANSTELKNDHASEIANRFPRRPFTALATDYQLRPGPGRLLQNVKFPKNITAYGLLIGGSITYGCPTRYGSTRSVKKCGSLLFDCQVRIRHVAMMRLGQLYGNTTYSQLIRDYLPQYVLGGDWSKSPLITLWTWHRQLQQERV